MNRNTLYIIIDALVMATVVFSHQLSQERQKTQRHHVVRFGSFAP